MRRPGRHPILAACALATLAASVAPAAAEPPTGGARTAAVVLLRFAGDPVEPVDASAARAVAFGVGDSVSAWLADQTAGAVTLRGLTEADGEVLGPYTVARGSGCDRYGWAEEAASAAAVAGVDLAAYDHVVHALPATAACAWSGRGEISGPMSWVNGAASFERRTLAHALGHNLGAHHAGTMRCTDVLGEVTTLSGTCTAVSDHGDPDDVMGGGDRRHVQAATKRGLLWLGPDAVQTVTADGSYVVAPSVRPTTAVRVLRVARGWGPALCLDVRAPSDSAFDVFDAADPAVTGVTARLCPTYGRTRLLDATPDTATFADAPLPVGRSLTDLLHGYTVTTESVTPVGATVRIRFHGDEQAPTAPPRPTARIEASGGVRLTWLAARDNVRVSSYRVLRDGVQIATAAGRSLLDVPPTTRVSYSVQAVDDAGHVGPPSPTVTVEPPAPPPASPVPAPPSAHAPVAAPPSSAPGPSGPRADEQPPTAPARPSIEAAGLTAVSLRWSPATDDRRVTGYAVFRGSARLRDVTTTAFIDTGLAPDTTYTYAVRAYDAAGNLGPPARLSATTRRWNGALIVSRASLHRGRRGAATATLRVVAHTAETPPGPVRCSWRLDGGRPRRCRVDRSGTTVVQASVRSRRAVVWLRVVDPSGRVFSARRTVRG